MQILMKKFCQNCVTRCLTLVSTPTAIQRMPSAVGKPAGVYDLSGRRVIGEPRKGIYIINGTKILR